MREYIVGEERTRVFMAALIGSAVLFLLHKIEDRFKERVGPSCGPTSPTQWQCRFPGIVLSHKPWSRGLGALVMCIYAALATAVILVLQRAAAAASRAAWPACRSPAWWLVMGFTLLWTAWGHFEMHHMRRPEDVSDNTESYTRGKPKRGYYFASLFALFVFCVYLPVAVYFLYIPMRPPVDHAGHLRLPVRAVHVLRVPTGCA